MDLFHMAKTFRRKTGRKTRSNKKSNRRTRRKVGGSNLTALLVALAAALAPKAEAVPAASYHDKPGTITVGKITLPATPNGSGYNIKKEDIKDKLGEDTLKELERLDKRWFSSQNDVSISLSDLKNYGLKTIRPDITPEQAEAASGKGAPYGRLI